MKAQVRKYDRSVRRQNVQMLVLALAGIGLMMLQREIRLADGNGDGGAAAAELPIALANTAVTLSLLVCLCWYYKTQMRINHRLRKARRAASALSPHTTPPLSSLISRGTQAPHLGSSNLGRSFAMELVVLAFYPPPLVDVGDWALLMFFRLYLGLRVLRDYNEMYSNRADLSRSQEPAAHAVRVVPALKNWFFFYPVAIVLLFLVTLTFI